MTAQGANLYSARIVRSLLGQNRRQRVLSTILEARSSRFLPQSSQPDMQTFTQKLKALEASMSRLRTQDEKVSALADFMQHDAEQPAATQNLYGGAGAGPNTSSIDKDRDARMKAQGIAISQLVRRQGISVSDLTSMAASRPRNQSTLPLRVLLCAFQDVNAQDFCFNPGTLTCAGCHLVRYCSKECQKRHWKSHKIGMSSPRPR